MGASAPADRGELRRAAARAGHARHRARAAGQLRRGQRGRASRARSQAVRGAPGRGSAPGRSPRAGTEAPVRSSPSGTSSTISGTRVGLEAQGADRARERLALRRRARRGRRAGRRRRLRLAEEVFALAAEAIRAPLEAYSAGSRAALGRRAREWPRFGRCGSSWRARARNGAPTRRRSASASCRASSARRSRAARRGGVGGDGVAALGDGQPRLRSPGRAPPLGTVFSTGGYHNGRAYPALDGLACAWADLCQLAERQTERLVVGAVRARRVRGTLPQPPHRWCRSRGPRTRAPLPSRRSCRLAASARTTRRRRPSSPGRRNAGLESASSRPSPSSGSSRRRPSTSTASTAPPALAGLAGRDPRSSSRRSRRSARSGRTAGGSRPRSASGAWRPDGRPRRSSSSSTKRGSIDLERRRGRWRGLAPRRRRRMSTTVRPRLSPEPSLDDDVPLDRCHELRAGSHGRPRPRRAPGRPAY